MKKFIPILLVIAVAAIAVTACNSKPPADTDGKVLTYVDTTGLAAFQAWKAQNELKDPNVYYVQGNEVVPTYTPPVKKKTVVKRTTSSASSGSMNSVSSYPAKKKGWSRKAKGAAIGGGAGAILGAVVNKKSRVKGGIFGGLLGAGLGYVIGNEMDRKKGR